MTSQEQQILLGLGKEYLRIFNLLLKVIHDDTFCLRPCLRIIRWTFGERVIAELFILKFVDNERFRLVFKTHGAYLGDSELKCSNTVQIAEFVSSMQEIADAGDMGAQLDDFVEVQTSAIA